MENCVYYGCSAKEKVLLYKVPCNCCKKEFTLAIKPDYTDSSVGGYLPKCPYENCNGRAFSIHKGWPTPFENDRIDLREQVMGGMNPTALYSLYPELEGENQKDRDLRILSHIRESCENVMNDNPTMKEDLILKIYKKNPYISHEVNRILGLVATAETEEKRKECMAAIDKIEPMQSAVDIRQKLFFTPDFSVGRR